MRQVIAVVLMMLACEPLCPQSEDGGSRSTLPTGGGGGSGGGLGWCGGQAGGGSAGGSASCVGTPEPAELGGCLPERACSGVAGRYVLTRAEADGGCQVQWSNPLHLRVSMDAGCAETGSIRWAADSGCDFEVRAEHSARFPYNGECWGVWHTIEIAATARPNRSPTFVATTGGYGEGGSCPAVFALDGGE